jgi:DNA-binding response OmpR family regulator
MNPNAQRLCGPARALIVTEAGLAEIVRDALQSGHYRTQAASTAQEAAGLLKSWKPHLIIVEMDTPASAILDRLSDAGRLRDRPPIVALTRDGDLKTKLVAFERGADDILTVPFFREEFGARVLALMRRIYRDAAVFSPVLRHGDLEIDIRNRRVRDGDRPLHLTALEQSLLYLLATNEGRVLTRNEILDYLWGTDYVAESNVVDRHIRNLRVKLESVPRHRRCIATVPGRGYKFVLREEAS